MTEPLQSMPSAVLRPTALADAVQFLAEAGAEAIIVSSAAHLMARQSRRLWRPGSLILDISGLSELDGIQRVGRNVAIGAMTSFAEMARSSLIDRRARALLDAAAVAGGPQCRNRNTLGGEIMAGSPGGEGLAALLALDARVVLLSNEGPRSVPLYAFYTGYRQPVATDSELLTTIEIPVLPPNAVTYHRKAASKGGFGRSKVVMSGNAQIGPSDEEGRTRLKCLRLGIGAVAPIPTRLFETERFLMAAPISEERLAESLLVMASEISPIDDFWSTAAYRRLVATNMLREFLQPLTANARPQAG